ncbi:MULTISPECIES: toxin-antitoxin system YwqK family antitoxin [Pontibacter]|uniref:MORN repeat variant n=1 Tax=Pontibacter lucknowensis TaxID=1077936 RepID=A0A1N6U0S0_9BACT|nr:MULTISPECIES: hypothetical protein [Pontibacter]SIQ59220.1 MORN repeat variant [Pontibacter lucknowensis]
MKHAILSVFFTLWLGTAFAQQEKMIFYNTNWLITKQEHAAFARSVIMPDTVAKFSTLRGFSFDGDVIDYYSNGKVLANGFYDKGVKRGHWQFFHFDGKPESSGAYENDHRVGEWKFWWPNGQLMNVLLYDSLGIKVMHSWSEDGKQQVVNGNGRVSIKLEEDENSKAMLEGSYRNGLKDGLWRRTNKKGQSEIEQLFSNGELVKDQKFKPSLAYLNPGIDRFEVGNEPYYLEKVERWMVDPQIYAGNYPVVASVMGWEVEAVKVKSKPDYYKVYAQLEGKPFIYEEHPTTAPEFPGGDKAYQSYMNKYIINPLKLSGVKFEKVVYVDFDITDEGKVGNVILPKGIQEEIVKDIITKGFTAMPIWKPATRNLEPIYTRYRYPLNL